MSWYQLRSPSPSSFSKSENDSPFVKLMNFFNVCTSNVQGIFVEPYSRPISSNWSSSRQKRSKSLGRHSRSPGCHIHRKNDFASEETQLTSHSSSPGNDRIHRRKFKNKSYKNRSIRTKENDRYFSRREDKSNRSSTRSRSRGRFSSPNHSKKSIISQRPESSNQPRPNRMNIEIRIDHDCVESDDVSAISAGTLERIVAKQEWISLLNYTNVKLTESEYANLRCNGITSQTQNVTMDLPGQDYHIRQTLSGKENTRNFSYEETRLLTSQGISKFESTWNPQNISMATEERVKNTYFADALGDGNSDNYDSLEPRQISAISSLRKVPSTLSPGDIEVGTTITEMFDNNTEHSQFHLGYNNNLFGGEEEI